MDPVALVETVLLFNPELAGYVLAEKTMLTKLSFRTKTTVQDNVALAFVYVSAVRDDNIIQRSVVDAMHSFLSVPKQNIRDLLALNNFKEGGGGQGGIGKYNWH